MLLEAEQRLAQLDDGAAFMLVLEMKRQMITQLHEERWAELQRHPMPVDEQARIMRVLYAALGDAFEPLLWYMQMIVAWDRMSEVHERTGALVFRYADAMERYRQLASSLGMEVTDRGEAASAIMQGAVYTAITGEPYEFAPPAEA